MHLGTHLRQNSPDNVLETHREKVFLSLRDFLKYDFIIKGKKDMKKLHKKRLNG